MISKIRKIYNPNWISLVVLTLLAMSPVSALQAKELPEVSSDGLHLQKNTKVRVAYLKPGAMLSDYSKINLLDCFVQFEKDWQKDYNMQELGLDGRVSDRDAEDIKKRVAHEFREVFTKVLTEDGHEVVEGAGPDVLIVRPAILNLNVTAPETNRIGRGDVYVASAGYMTLYMEMFDSESGTLLARVADPKADRGRGFAMRANRVTNKAEADRILRGWAKLLSGHLGDVRENTGTQ